MLTARLSPNNCAVTGQINRWELNEIVVISVVASVGGLWDFPKHVDIEREYCRLRKLSA